MRKKVILITGACGEIGHALVNHLLEYSDLPILTFDLQEMKKELREKVTHIRGSVTDEELVQHLVGEYEFETIFHLASLLSTTAEFTPVMAHNVNVQGTLYLLNIAAEQSEFRRKPVKFIYPSSIAAYGLPDLKTKSETPKVREWEWNNPSTMYGANKLYCELLGIYFSDHYKQLAESRPITLDFRAIRFPGLISAYTVPSGGTSDYGPEMLYAAAKGERYDGFVRPDTTINFMAMPDAVKALVDLEKAPAENLSRRVYNVTSFSLSAEQFCGKVMESFPDAEIGYKVHENRQNIVDTWPMDTDDKAAREDWGWDPEYDLEKCFNDYLVPNIKNRY